MKTVNQVLGLHPSSNHNDNVIRYTSMPNKNIYGYIDQNKTIFLNKDLRYKDQVKTIKHEEGHKKQMLEGRLKFDSLLSLEEHFQSLLGDMDVCLHWI